MEIRQFAERILLSDTLAEKLLPLELPATDEQPGEAWRPVEPVRPENLKFAPRKAAPAMPHPSSFTDSERRGVAHHIMANHELQALEVMAFILCAFPEAPPEFRREILPIIADEQRHTRMHCERAARLGVEFGTLPVNCYIWKKAQSFTSLLDYLAGLPLTFEGRNLDHTLEFERYFLEAGDERSAAMMRRIHEDEISHVAFGIRWLRALKPPHLTDFEAWQAHLHWPLRPDKAIGDEFQREARLAAGLTEDFIDQLLQSRNEDQQA